MKDISIGIYHKDHQYGKRLMEYLNHQKDFPMTASFTSDEEMFFKQEQEGDFECLVLAEETDYHGDFPVCRTGQAGFPLSGNSPDCCRFCPAADKAPAEPFRWNCTWS